MIPQWLALSAQHVATVRNEWAATLTSTKSRLGAAKAAARPVERTNKDGQPGKPRDDKGKAKAAQSKAATSRPMVDVGGAKQLTTTASGLAGAFGSGYAAATSGPGNLAALTISVDFLPGTRLNRVVPTSTGVPGAAAADMDSEASASASSESHESVSSLDELPGSSASDASEEADAADEEWLGDEDGEGGDDGNDGDQDAVALDEQDPDFHAPGLQRQCSTAQVLQLLPYRVDGELRERWTTLAMLTAGRNLLRSILGNKFHARSRDHRGRSASSGRLLNAQSGAGKSDRSGLHLLAAARLDALGLLKQKTVPTSTSALLPPCPLFAHWRRIKSTIFFHSALPLRVPIKSSGRLRLQSRQSYTI